MLSLGATKILRNVLQTDITMFLLRHSVAWILDDGRHFPPLEEVPEPVREVEEKTLHDEQEGGPGVVVVPPQPARTVRVVKVNRDELPSSGSFDGRAPCGDTGRWSVNMRNVRFKEEGDDRHIFDSTPVDYHINIMQPTVGIPHYQFKPMQDLQYFVIIETLSPFHSIGDPIIINRQSEIAVNKHQRSPLCRHQIPFFLSI